MSFMLNKNNLVKVVWIFYHVFPLTDHVGLHHTWVWRVFFLCWTWASTLEQLEDIARLLSLGIDVGALLVLHHFLLNVVLLLLQSSPACSCVLHRPWKWKICNIPKENASNIHVLHRDAWQQMPGQRVVRSMIGELAVALASAVEAALTLAADAPFFLMADLAASLHQRNWGVVLWRKEW